MPRALEDRGMERRPIFHNVHYHCLHSIAFFPRTACWVAQIECCVCVSHMVFHITIYTYTCNIYTYIHIHIYIYIYIYIHWQRDHVHPGPKIMSLLAQMKCLSCHRHNVSPATKTMSLLPQRQCLSCHTGNVSLGTERMEIIKIILS